ncbi:rCG32476 [Rattus norvegicus]|uniref:RCG32476 n=1 Tax=Rattus norvegicus TaxID=10116 RepID=A6HHL6_RAT|nr:rCG32476 [Rattus norvegicus]
MKGVICITSARLLSNLMRLTLNSVQPGVSSMEEPREALPQQVERENSLPQRVM